MRSLIREGILGPFYCGGQEILRRIVVSVRDRDWREVPIIQWQVIGDETSMTAQIEARHTSDCVDFEWRGHLRVSSDLRRIQLQFEGRALRDMDVCRLGLVILHPVESMIGAEVTAHGPHGLERLIVSRMIHPQSIVKGLPSAMMAPFSVLEIEREDVGLLRMELTGDLFELEDQRNWGDASFKTYCTPLSLGFPRHLTQGTLVSQAVEISYTPSFSGQTGRRPHSGLPASTRMGAEIQSGRRPVQTEPSKKPAIGCVVTDAAFGRLMNASAIGAWDHLQLGSEAVTPEFVTRLLGVLPRSTQLELVVPVQQDPARLNDVAGLFRGHEDRIARILVTDSKQALPSARDVASLRLMIAGALLRNVPTFLMPRGYFVELNRGEPLNFDVDGFAFPLSSTVHASDPESVIDNVAAASDMVATLRALTKGAQIAVSPLAAYYPTQELREGIGGPLWGSWVTRTIARLSAAGVTSITLAWDLIEARP